MKKLALTLAIVLGLSMTTFAEGGVLLACLATVAMKTLTPPSALASPC